MSMLRPRASSLLLTLTVGIVAVALHGAPARAASATPQSETTVNAFSGGLTSTVQIGVPAFRGLEPKLGLTYSSGSGNGLVGVGWTLAGVSVIERASPGGGAPRFDGNDIFRLDGNVLVPCAQAAGSASCTSGGTHASRIESYSKIAYDGTANTWTVWERTGVKATYAARSITGRSDFRWTLASVADPKGNSVAYTWWCDGTNDCYLDTVAYNGTVVTLYREARTDVLTYATGAGMARTSYRLKSVDVKVGGARARAYKLTYATSGATARSLVASVQQFGRDATVDASGTVSGGTSLPAVALTADASAAHGAAAATWAAYEAAYKSSWIFSGDFDGDGRKDILFLSNSYTVNGWRLMRGTATGFATPVKWASYDAVYDSPSWVFPGDYNGDGKTDLLYLSNSYTTLGWRLLASTGTTAAAPVTWAPYEAVSAVSWIFPGDVNGDGKTDLLYLANNYPTLGYRLLASTGTAAAAPVTWAAYDAVYKSPTWVFPGDYNGDGKTDLLYLSNTYTTTGWKLLASQGTAAAAPVTWAAWDPVYSAPTWVFPGDYNGDGKTDLLYLSNSYTTLGWRLLASTGSAAVAPVTWAAWDPVYSSPSWIFPGDYNGDGRADLLYLSNSYTTLGWRLLASRGTAAATPVTWAPYDPLYDSPAWARAGDFNGDGKTDLMYLSNSYPTLGWRGIAAQAGTDLVTAIGNGLGGSTTVAYLPSSRWSGVSTALPVGLVFQTVSSVTTSDGRGDAQTTNYAYEAARWRDATAADPVREFLGFRKATTTLAATGAYSETYYWQRAGTIAKPEVIYKRKASSAIMSFDKYTFTENTTPPYTSLVTEAWGFECNGDGVADANNNYVSGCRRVKTAYEWDVYGNLAAEYQHGDFDVAGDERTAVRSFATNTTAYIVGLPAYDEMRAGIGKTGTLLTRTRFFYDGTTTVGAAPVTCPAAGDLCGGTLTKKTVWDDQTGNYIAHTFAYDSFGNETAVTDPLANTSTRTYDATYHILVTATTNPLGHVMQTAWDGVLGLPTSETDADNNVTTHAYDALGRATLSTSPDGAQVKLDYLDWGNPALQRIRSSRLLPGGAWLADEDWFDGLSRPYKKTSANGVTEDTIYGASGKVWKKSLPHAGSDTVRYDVYTYDEIGRELSMARPDGVTLSRSYDDGSVTVTPPVGSARTRYFDGFGRITKARETIGGVARDTFFYYDLLGRRTKSVDALGNQTVASYDSLGRVLQRSDPDKGVWTYSYNKLGRITAETDALGATTTLGYDSLGRVTRRTYADATQDSFTFDGSGRGSSKGRLTTAVSASGVTTQASYDSLGRRTRYEEVIDGITYAISHTYDVAGRVATVTYPDNEVVTYGYGTSGLELGRLVTVTGSMAGPLVTAVGYTSKGQVATTTLGNNLTTTTGFDAYGERVSSIQFGAKATITYGYDANGFVTSMTSSQLSLTKWAYGYDSIGRLTSAANSGDGTRSESYGFDAIGRLTSRTGVGSYGYLDAAHVHAVTSAGGNTYAYDANGNMTAGAGRGFAYDLDHKVASISWTTGTTSFTYDALGQRVKKAGPGGTVLYVGALYESRGGAVTKYYFAGAARVAKRDTNGNSYLHADHLGSTRLVTNASGAEVKRYEYAPWGPVIAETGSRPESHRFTGQEADDETGLMYYQARYYDPALGRFTQADGFVPDADSPQALDLYAYANNSPANYVDPSGHAPVVPALVAWVAGALAVEMATAALIVNIAALVIGTALTFTNNPYLQTLGMIMSGMAGGALAGPLAGLNAANSCWVAGAVQLAQSPISPLDPTIKKVIGWGYTMWGGITSIGKLGTGMKDLTNEISWASIADMTGAEWVKGVWRSALNDVRSLAVGWSLAYALTKWGGTAGRYALAIGGRFLLLGGSQLLSRGYGGALAMVGASYDLAYTLKYPDGRVYDLSGGGGGETFTLYTHTGYENPLAFGRQHIRVGDPQGGFWELGDFRAGHFGPGLGWAGWGSTQKIKVILSPTQAAAFRDALAAGAKAGGAYMGFHKDSYTYVSAALLAVTGKSAGDLHINKGLIHW